MDRGAVGAALLIVLALPIFGLRLGFSDEGNYPEEPDVRQAYDLLAEGSGRASTARSASPPSASRHRPGGPEESSAR